MGLALPAGFLRHRGRSAFFPRAGSAAVGAAEPRTPGLPSGGRLPAGSSSRRARGFVLSPGRVFPSSSFHREDSPLWCPAFPAPSSRSLSIGSVPNGRGRAVPTTTPMSAPASRDPLPSDASRALLRADRPTTVGPWFPTSSRCWGQDGKAGGGEGTGSPGPLTPPLSQASPPS